jgi:Linear amide C-N hydrolases, choloylglycine hydrolase family
MARRLRAALSLLILVFLASPHARPCTTFVTRDANRLLFGRNLDWFAGIGLIMSNPRRLSKVALVAPTETPARWTSRYGSLTFNQVGRDFPYGGINEAGLVVEHMTLDTTAYPSPDQRPAISACQWIQYQLDNSATAEEVIASDRAVRIVDSQSKFHFLVCDRKGHVAVVEFLDGKMVSHIGRDLPVEVLANGRYDDSLKAYRAHRDVEADRSLYNFATAARMVSADRDAAAPDGGIARAFRALEAVRQGLFTKWSIVYDIRHRTVYVKVFETPTIVGEQKIFRKKPGEATTKVVELGGFDFACSRTGKVLDLDSEITGKANSHFADYSTEVNRDLVFRTFTFFRQWGIPVDLTDEDLTGLARYPESFRCQAKR